MADKNISPDIGNDNDLECDFAIQNPMLKKDIFHDEIPHYNKEHEFRSNFQDSGVYSMVSIDKCPVQCSDINKLSDQIRDIGISADDEGFSMKSFKSFDSESSQISVPEPEPAEIEIDLNATDEDGDTLIHVAIVSLMSESALALIDIAIDSDCLNIQNYLHQCPLHLAVLTRQTEIVKALIEKGANVTLRDQQGNTPLHIACRMGDRDSVMALVKSFGDDVSGRKEYFAVRNCEGLTCVHVASQYKEFLILGHLFAKGADVNIGDAKSGRTILHYAAENKDMATVTKLLTHRNIDVDCKTFKGETPLVLAFWRNAEDIVKKLMSKGAEFSYDLFEESDDDNYV